MSISIHDLDSIVIIWIVAGRNHNAAVEIFCTDYICHTWRGGNMQQKCICSGCRNTGNQRILKHVTTTTYVLSDNDPSPVILVVIPAQVTSNFICMIRGQYFVCLTAKTVCSEIFSHDHSLLSCTMSYEQNFANIIHTLSILYLLFIQKVRPLLFLNLNKKTSEIVRPIYKFLFFL